MQLITWQTCSHLSFQFFSQLPKTNQTFNYITAYCKNPLDLDICQSVILHSLSSFPHTYNRCKLPWRKETMAVYYQTSVKEIIGTWILNGGIWNADILLVGQKRTDTKSYQTNENITVVISFINPGFVKIF